MARPRQITDEQILSTMRSSVLQHGPAVSLDLVAEQLNVTSPALIKRFGTRQALMIAALKPPEDNAWMRKMAVGPDDRPLQVQLEEIISSYTEAFAEAMPCMFALRESGIPFSAVFPPTEVSPAVRVVRATTRWLGQLAERGLVRGEALETASTALVGAVSTRAVTAHLTRTPWSPRAQREYARQLSLLFTRALTPDNRKSKATP
jgi:AcrR family transcriptional regulator